MENWLPVVGCEDRYEVSNHGQVRSVASGKYRKLETSNRGYLILKMRFNGETKQSTRSVHGLVAEAFLGPKPVNAQVNHKDCDKQNNRAENLEWVTALENVQHAADHGLLVNRGGNGGGHGRPQSGALNFNSKLTEDQATKIIGRLVTGEGVKPLAREFGISHTLVRAIKTRKRWAHLPWQ